MLNFSTRSSIASIASCVLLSAALLAGSAQSTAQSKKTPPKTPPKAVSAVTGFPTIHVWTIELGATKPIGPPVAGGDRVFLALESGVSAHRLSDRADLWTKPIVASARMAASKDRLVVPTKDALLVLDAATGEPVWTAGPGPFTAPPRIHDDLLFAASGEKLTAYDLATGAELWTADTGVVEQRPTVSGARVYVPAADGRLLVLDLKSRKLLWSFDVGIKPTEPLVDGGRIFVGSATREFWCLRESDSGDRELWRQLTAAPVIGVPAIDDRRVYFAAFDNVLRALDRYDGGEEWKFPVKYRPSTGPLLAGAQLVLPGFTERVETIDARTGKAVGALSLPEKINGVPALVESADGRAKFAVFFGGLNQDWKMILTEPPLPTYAAPDVTPLTVLPGRVVPPTALQIPRG